MIKFIQASCLAFAILAAVSLSTLSAQQPTNWASFRGNSAKGTANDFQLPTSWNADSQIGENQRILWETRVPGLGHSSPVIFGDKLFFADSNFGPR